MEISRRPPRRFHRTIPIIYSAGNCRLPIPQPQNRSTINGWMKRSRVASPSRPDRPWFCRAKSRKESIRSSLRRQGFGPRWMRLANRLQMRSCASALLTRLGSSELGPSQALHALEHRPFLFSIAEFLRRRQQSPERQSTNTAFRFGRGRCPKTGWSARWIRCCRKSPALVMQRMPASSRKPSTVAWRRSSAWTPTSFRLRSWSRPRTS